MAIRSQTLVIGPWPVCSMNRVAGDSVIIGHPVSDGVPTGQILMVCVASVSAATRGTATMRSSNAMIGIVFGLFTVLTEKRRLVSSYKVVWNNPME